MPTRACPTCATRDEPTPSGRARNGSLLRQATTELAALLQRRPELTDVAFGGTRLALVVSSA